MTEQETVVATSLEDLKAAMEEQGAEDAAPEALPDPKIDEHGRS